MKKLRLVMGLSLALFAVDSSLAGTNDSTPGISRPATAEVMDIAPVWAGHPVGFALLTHAPFQFVAFYDDQRQLTLAQRRLNERKWTFTKLPVTTGWDSHNYITLAADDDGYLHLSGDMHANPLKYFRTTKPWDASTFERVEKMVGPNEQRTTYPVFFRGPKNAFLFTYRDGSSGNGNQVINRYDAKTKSWKRLLDHPLTDGEGHRNAYFDGPVKGPDGWFHLAWVWRESGDASSNHHLSYARSRDLIDWEAGDGKPLPLPISLKTSDIVDPVPPKGGIINGNAKIGFDNRGRVTISYHKYDAAGNTQPWTARLENGKWQRYQITDWPHRWDFSGGGTLVFSISLGAVHLENDGRLTQTYRHVKFGGGTWLIDPETLRATGKVTPPKSPPVLSRVDGTFPGLQARGANDSGESGVPGLSYRLRWETLEANRDRPRAGALPPPSTLRLVTIKAPTE
ncbi:MAG: BNR repeat-containing protein [Verrucomicrobiota bacterium]